MDSSCPFATALKPFRLLSLLLLAFGVKAILFSQEAPISSEERSIVETMLDEVKGDVKGSYYDPKYHNVDLDARFKEAKEHIKNAKTYNQAIASVAWALRPLNDSHTFLVPPRRTYKMTYGYQFSMVGDGCFVTAVQPGSDAEKKGLRVGDQILSLNKVAPSRDNLWELNYLFRILRPQAADELVLQNPDATQQTLVISPKIAGEAYRITTGIDYWDLIRESQSYWNIMRRRSYTLGESVIIWNFPTFMVDDKAVDEMIGQSSKYPSMILDLRGDSGGSLTAMLRLIGSVVDHDLTVGKPVTRKVTPPFLAQTRGDKTYRGKIIVLVDSRSASASELFARTMQLEKRATIVGDLTSGKVMEARFHFHALGLGSAQGYGVMISEADLLMPDGKSLEHTGVMPDEKVLPTGKDLAANRDPVLSYAVHLAGVELSAEDAGKLFPMEWPK